jgi:hypothetical protein
MMEEICPAVLHDQAIDLLTVAKSFIKVHFVLLFGLAFIFR